MYTQIASALVSGYASGVQSSLQGREDRANIASNASAAQNNITYAKNDYILRSEISYQQENAIDREMGSMLSQRGLEAMKAEARLRASGASTGLSGASIDEVVNQTGYDQLLDNQVIIARARSSKLDTQRTRLADYMNFKAVANGYTQGTNMATGSSGLAGLNAGLSTLQNYQSLSGESIFSGFNSIQDSTKKTYVDLGE